jgi:hypothetical protein
MRNSSFRYCMLIGAAALLGVAIYYFVAYVPLIVALGSSGMKLHYQDAVRAQWLAFGVQSLLIAVLYIVVAFRPRAVTREVIVLLGLLQLAESLLLFTFAENRVAMSLLGVAAVFVLVGSVLWPRASEPPPAPDAPAEIELP